MSEEVFVVCGARAPMGALQGNLGFASTLQLGATAIREAVRRAGIDVQLIDEVVMGTVLPAGMKQAPAWKA